MAKKPKIDPNKETARPRSRRRPPTSPVPPSDELRIAVTFRRPTDQLGLTKTARLSPEALQQFRPDHRALGRAVDMLQESGFTITSQGRLSLSMRGKRRDFERLFRTTLTPVSVASIRGTRLSSNSVFYPAEGVEWNPAPEIEPLIDDAYIQWPHIYLHQRFQTPPSALPPQVRYHHLRVPGDVTIVLNADRVHRQGTTGRGVRVAMIDSGFNHSHPYFAERGYNSTTVLASGATNVDRDRNGHGTGESANLLAIAPDATFVGVKLDNDDNPAASASLLEGFQEAMTHDPHVISVSLGYDLVIPGTRKHRSALPNSLKALQAEIQEAVASGVVVVLAAGNGHVAFPGMMPEVLSAGGVFVAVNGDMQASDYASAFESRIYAGRRVPDFCGLVGLAKNGASYIMLPIEVGCEIDAKRKDGTTTDDGWGVFSGTSAAAPQLAGVCALLLEKSPSLTPAEIRAVLRRSSRDVVAGTNNAASSEDVPIPAGVGNDGATGTGLIDAFRAWRQV